MTTRTVDSTYSHLTALNGAGPPLSAPITH